MAKKQNIAGNKKMYPMEAKLEFAKKIIQQLNSVSLKTNESPTLKTIAANLEVDPRTLKGWIKLINGIQKAPKLKFGLVEGKQVTYVMEEVG